MRQWQCHLYHDAQVLCTADCWTDHKLQVKAAYSKKNCDKKASMDVTMLQRDEVQTEYNEVVSEGLTSVGVSDVSGSRKWEVFQDSILTAAERVLGRER